MVVALIATCVNGEGHREVLDLHDVTSETRSAWRAIRAATPLLKLFQAFVDPLLPLLGNSGLLCWGELSAAHRFSPARRSGEQVVGLIPLVPLPGALGPEQQVLDREQEISVEVDP